MSLHQLLQLRDTEGQKRVKREGEEKAIAGGIIQSTELSLPSSVLHLLPISHPLPTYPISIFFFLHLTKISLISAVTSLLPSSTLAHPKSVQ